MCLLWTLTALSCPEGTSRNETDRLTRGGHFSRAPTRAIDRRVLVGGGNLHKTETRTEYVCKDERIDYGRCQKKFVRGRWARRYVLEERAQGMARPATRFQMMITLQRLVSQDTSHTRHVGKPEHRAACETRTRRQLVDHTRREKRDGGGRNRAS